VFDPLAGPSAPPRQRLARVRIAVKGHPHARPDILSRMTADPAPLPKDFIRDIVRQDNAEGTYGQRVQTRFPPEPNGYLHIGHAKAIVVDFGIAADFGGICNLRFDDTNPDTEQTEYVDSILDDIRWLGYEPAGVLHASDYFEQLYEWAEHLIGEGLAYVDDQDNDTISAQRGGFGQPGVDSPFRDRSVEDNLDLFRRMAAGEFEEGSRVLRARIDMQHENMQLRDPVMYRIRHASHHRTGDRWHIYPTYDWAHGQSDAIEGVTHSICTLEFDTHRRLYDWYLEHLPLPGDKPKQIEFARLELTHTVTSKRKLAKLVADGVVDGWDDPRMPTLRGLRRRGYPPTALREFCREIGTTRTNSRQRIEALESVVRRQLNATAQRRMAVVKPVRVVITNWPTDDAGAPVVEWFEVANNPENAEDGTRRIPFGDVLYIESDDFRADPPPKYFRLAPGREVRLRGAYLVTCTGFTTDDDGTVTEIQVTYDPATKGGSAPDGRKVKSTMHWVSAAHAIDATVALYDRLFSAEFPGDGTGDPLDDLNAASRTILTGCKLEPALADTAPGEVVQFERLGYFAHDTRTPLLFHRTVGLRDEWAAIQRRQG
jgi:glutaminyl-tRNA synthetase